MTPTYAVPGLFNVYGDPYVFQKNNASVHTSISTRQRFRLNNIQRSMWSAVTRIEYN